MERPRGTVAVFVALVFCLAGCDGPSAKPVVMSAAGLEPSVDYSDLAAVLQEAVTSDGALVPERLKEHSGRLDAQLQRMIVTGPTASPQLLPSRADRLAYWHNARVGWALKLSLLCDCPKSIPGRNLHQRPFPLDGRTMTLRQIDAALAAEGGWKAEVAAGGVSIHRARLPARPFTPAGIDRRTDDRLTEFVDDPSRFVIDVARQKILVPPVLWRYRAELIASHNRKCGTRGATFTTALLQHVRGSALRRLQDAIGYKVVPARHCGRLAIEP